MTPSIIRRFAKYHGIDAGTIDDDSTAWALEGLAIGLHGCPTPDNLCKVVRTLTRIEDAEMLGWSASNKTRSSDASDVLMLERDCLLLRAGVEPTRWLEVTE